MRQVVKWVAGTLGGVLALGGLFMAANASDNGFYAAGMVVFVVGLMYAFYQMKRGLDEMEAAQHAGRAAGAGGASGGSGSKAASAGGKGAGPARGNGSAR